MKKTILFIIVLCTSMVCKAQNDSIRRIMENIKDPKRIVSVEVVQKAIEINLDSIRMLDYKKIPIKRFAALTTNPEVQKRYYYDYFTEKAKQRMVELFEGKWTEEEIKARVNSSMRSTFDTLSPYNGYYKTAKKIAKRDSLPLQRVWDSMIMIRRKEWGEDLLKSKSVDNEVINIAGYLRDPRFLPYLKNMDKGNYVGNEAELALARYGEEPYHSNAVKRHYKRGNFSNLAYICSNEAIEKLYEYAMTEERIDCNSHGMDCYSLSAESAMSRLVVLFNSKEMSKEMRKVRSKHHYPELRKPNKAYLKKMRSITKKYYRQFKKQEPDCENVAFDIR